VKHGLGRELMEARHPPCCPCAKENAAKRQKQNRQPFISIISHLQKGKGKGKGLAQRASGKSTRDDTNATFRFNIICHRRCSAGRQKNSVTLQSLHCKKLTLQTAVYDHTHQHRPQRGSRVAILQMLI